MQALLFRIISILRPAGLLVVIRALNLEDARLYAAALSRYVIASELYNLLLPTDGLYKKGATLDGAVALATARARIAMPIMLLSAIVLFRLSGSAWQAVAISCTAALSAIAVPFYGYAFPRLALRRLAWLEASFHLGAFAALLGWLATGSIWVVLVFTLLEIPLKGVIVVLADRSVIGANWRQQWARRRELAIHQTLLEGVRAGLPITLANYFFRLPFALPFPSGSLDPLFMLCAQAMNSFYNLVLVVHSERLSTLIRRFAHVSLMMGAVGVAIAFGIGKLDRLLVQFCLVSCFALPYACWLASLSGSDGLLQRPTYRTGVVALLVLILGAAAFVHPAVVWCAFLLPCSYFAFGMHRQYAKG
jgi:hypothetical protein